MGNTFFFSWEPTFMVWLQSHLGTFGLTLAKIFSLFGEEMVTILVLGFTYWGVHKELGKFIGRNACVAMMANPMIKNVFLRLRPYMVCPEVKCLSLWTPAPTSWTLPPRAIPSPAAIPPGPWPTSRPSACS